jgi:peptidyl-prolyl cis-trans isomerase D
MLSSFVLPGEVARAVALREETREVGYAVLPLAKFLPAAKVDEAAITAWYEAHKDSYRTPETVKLRYVALKVADVAREVAVDDAALRAYYDTVKERFTEAEKRRARHILIPSGSDDAAARKKADEAYAEAVKPGADFAALARKYSQDAGSAPQGGDLGWAEKSFFVAPFADALWGMKPGEVHAPVKTQFGWHVIRLEEVQPAKSRSFEEVRAELVPEYQKSEAERRFSESQEKLEQLAFEQSGSLEPIAKALGLRIEEVTGFRKDLPDNELAANPKVVAAAFSADVLGGQNSKAIELAPGDVVVLRATDHALPAQQPLEAVHAEVALAVRRAAAAADAKAAGERVAAALDAGASWEAALKPLGGAAAKGKTAPPADAIRLEAPKFVGRRDKELPPEIIAAAFAAPAPAAGKTLAANAVLASGDVAVYALTAVKPGVVKAGDDAARTELREASGTADFLTYLELLRAGADVHASPAIFE